MLVYYIESIINLHCVGIRHYRCVVPFHSLPHKVFHEKVLLCLSALSSDAASLIFGLGRYAYDMCSQTLKTMDFKRNCIIYEYSLPLTNYQAGCAASIIILETFNLYILYFVVYKTQPQCIHYCLEKMNFCRFM